MNTAIEYLYRDAGNYRQYGRVVLPGEITDQERELIAAALDSGLYFIPSQVGLPDLQMQMEGFPDSEADHVWHELDVKAGIVLTDDLPTMDQDVHALAAMFTGGWDVVAATKLLGIPLPGSDNRSGNASLTPTLKTLSPSCRAPQRQRSLLNQNQF